MITVQDRLKDACDAAGEFVSFRNDYIGRHMYGATCVGVTGTLEECQMTIAQVIKSMSSSLTAAALKAGKNDSSYMEFCDVEREFEEQVDQLMDYFMDNMGQGVIIYWPKLKSIDSHLL